MRTEASEILVGNVNILLAPYSAPLPDFEDVDAYVQSGTVPTGFTDMGSTTSNVVETRTIDQLLKRDQHSGLPIEAFNRSVDMTVEFTALSWVAQRIAWWLDGELIEDADSVANGGDGSHDYDQISVGGVGRAKKFRLVLIGAAPGDDDARTMVVYPRVVVSGDQVQSWGTEDEGGTVPMTFTALAPTATDIAANPAYKTGKAIYQGNPAPVGGG